jgi:hypothetical protein
MASTITLSASAAYGYSGKQYIARITGRDSKFTFFREFIGRKGGKRGDISEATVDDAGLYMTCDIDNKGRKDETFWVVEEKDGGIVKECCATEEAMKLAKMLDNCQTFEAAVLAIWPPKSPADLLREKIVEHKKKLATSIAKGDADGMIVLEKDGPLGAKGASVRRGDIITWRQAEIVRLEAEIVALENPAPVEVPDESQTDVNPLTSFTDDQIAAEFVRRGLTVQSAAVTLA